MGGLLYIEVRGGGLRTRGSAGAAGALVPCLLPLCFPPPCVSLPGAPLQALAPGTSYFCLFLRKKKIILLNCKFKKKKEKKWENTPSAPLPIPPSCPEPFHPVLTFVQASSLGSLVLYPVRRASNQGETLQTSFLIPPEARGVPAPCLPSQCKSCVLLSPLRPSGSCTSCLYISAL